jgi:zinc D-Ala-D-Ala carboxypeptidase
MDLTKRLSEHFTLAEMVHTSHRLISNRPSWSDVENLRLLCETLLEPIREQFGPLWITSGYRCPALNMLIGSSPTSAHLRGCAADFVPMWKVAPAVIVAWVVQTKLPFDQIIDEHSDTANWIHIGMAEPISRKLPRRQALTMRKGNYVQFGQDKGDAE